MKRTDVKGIRFGSLTDLEDVTGPERPIRCLVRCDCGVEKLVRKGDLVSGRTKSCGCLYKRTRGNATHGMSGTPFYAIWKGMRGRTGDRHNPNYGGRGVICDPRWSNFLAFYADMYEGYVAALISADTRVTLERNDPNGPYSKENCRWATYREQANNRRNSIVVEVDGVLRHLQDLSDETGISYDLLHHRVTNGCDNLLTPPKAMREPFKVPLNGQPLTLGQLSKATGIPYPTLYWRCAHGKDPFTGSDIHRTFEAED